MYLLIYEDGVLQTATELADDAFNAADDGYIDIVDITGEGLFKYYKTEWHKIESADVMKTEYDQDEVKKAFDTIKAAMQLDCPSDPGSYAHSWHCNIAMMCRDAFCAADIVDECCIDEIPAASNDAASRFMKLCFDVETKA